MAVHEATHGVVLHVLTKVRPTYAVRFPFLTTGSHVYLTRRSVAIAALSPAILWGIVLVVALFTVPAEYRLTAYILVTLNFAGSSGDYVEVVVAARQPRGALLQDDGSQIHVFVPQDQCSGPLPDPR
jgi:hypothetical protein